MDDNDKKPSLLKDVLDNMSESATNVTEVDFKSGKGDIIKTIGPDTEAILITFDKSTREIKLYHNGDEIDKAVFANTLKAETGFFSLFDHILNKFKKWRDAWVN